MTPSLAGKTVVVTRPERQAQSLVDALSSRGASVIRLPLIEIRDPDSWDDLDRAVKMLREGYFRWVIFTSSNAVAAVFSRIGVAGLDARAFGRTGVAAVGASTERSLNAHGIRPDLVPTTYRGEALAQELGHGSGRILLPRVADAPPATQEALASGGWSVEAVVCYANRRLRPRGPEAESVKKGDYDAITFTSPSAVQAFKPAIGEPAKIGLSPEDEGRLVACIGPSTADAARQAGFRVDVIPEVSTAEALAEALAEHENMTR